MISKERERLAPRWFGETFRSWFKEMGFYLFLGENSSSSNLRSLKCGGYFLPVEAVAFSRTMRSNPISLKSGLKSHRRPAVSWSAGSDIGRRRPNNEDAWGAFLLGATKRRPLAQTEFELEGLGALFVLSDGMGGTLAGEEASRFCVEEVVARLAQHSGWSKLSKTMRKAVIETHAALTQRSLERPEWRGMGATLSIVWLLPTGRVVIGHVGDSRIYRLRDGKVEQLTEDHNVGAGMVRRGELTAEAATRLKFRSLLEQAMGGDGAPISPQVVESEWLPGDAYALCCDGLYGPLGERTEAALGEAMQDNTGTAAQKLIDAANEAGGPDNITVILARLLPS